MDGAFAVKSLKEIDKRLRKVYDRGEEAAAKNNLGYAITMFRELLMKEPGLLEVRQRLRQMQFQNLGGKVSAFHQIVTSILTIPAWFLNMSLLKKGDKKSLLKAMDNAEGMLSMDCTAMLPLMMLDRAGFEADLPEVSVQALEWAVQFYPKSVYLWDRLGQGYSAAGMGKKCLAVYTKLSELQPNSVRWQDAMKDATAEAAMDAGGWNRVERGEADYQDLIRNKGEASRLEHSGHTFRTAEGLAQLIEAAKEDIIASDTADNRRRLAELLVEAERFEEAIEAYQSVQEKLGLTDPAIEQAILKVQIIRFDSGIREQEALANDEHLSDNEREAAREEADRLRKNKVHALLDSMRDRVRRFPNQVEDRFQLARMLMDDGEVDEAISHLQKLQSHPKLSVTATLYLGRCFYNKRVYDLAVEQFQKVIEDLKNMTTVKKDAYYDLAKTYEALGDTEQALACYKTIYAVDTSYRDVGEVIENHYKE